MKNKNVIYGAVIVVLVLLYAARFSGFSLGGGGMSKLPTNASVEAEKAKVQKLQVQLAELYKKQGERTDFRMDLVDRTAPFWRVDGKEWPTTEVQQGVERLAKRYGVKLTKVGAPRVVDLGDELHAIEVQISSNTSIKAFADFAQEVENYKPMLAWEQCNIRPNKLKGPDSIMVQGRVRAYVLSEYARAYLRGDPVVSAEDKK